MWFLETSSVISLHKFQTIIVSEQIAKVKTNLNITRTITISIFDFLIFELHQYIVA